MINSKKVIAFLFCLLFLPIQGCKPAPALEEIVYDMHAEEKDNSADMIENKENNPDKDDSIAPVKKGNTTENVRDRVRDIPNSVDSDASDSSSLANIPVAETNYSPSGADSPVTEIAKTGIDNSGTKNGASESESAQSESAETEPPEKPVEWDDDALKRTVIINGTKIEVPENVDRVSAVGESAILVHILGGNDRLVASSESLINNNISSKYFYSLQSSMKPEILWDSTGTSALNDESFNNLLRLEPQVCFEISGENTFSETQIEKLNEKGIAYLPLPKLNTSDNIRQAVQIIGDVLGDKSNDGGKNAPDVAQDYLNYSDALIKKIGDRVDKATFNLIDFNNDKNRNRVKKLTSSSNDTSNGTFHGKYSLYINYWDTETSYKIYNSTNVYMSGNGVAVAQSGYSASPLSYYMSLAGIINTSAMYPDFSSTLKWYVNPMIPSTKSVEITGEYTVPDGYYLTLTNNDISNNVGPRTNGLGNSELFPAIIVESNTIKQNIISNNLWQSYGYVTSSSGVTQNYGYLDKDGSIIESSIIGNYDIFVNPYGISSWSKGTAESILEPIWLAWKFYNAFSEKEVRDEIRVFYSKFYGISLSEGEISTIMAGLD